MSALLPLLQTTRDLLVDERQIMWDSAYAGGHHKPAVTLRAGVPVGIPYDDQCHLAQLAARNREVRRGREIAIACVLLAALVWLALIGGPDILLGK